MHLPSQNQENVKILAVCLTLPDKKKKNPMNLYKDKVLRKAWKSAHIGFWVCWLQFSMLELCVTSTFWVMMVFLNSLWQKMKKRHQFVQGKVFGKAWISAHIGFWVCWLQCTMLELCVTSMFWVMMVFSWFLTGRSRYRVHKHGVWVEWDPRRTAA